MPALPNVASTLRVALSGTIGTSYVWLSRCFIEYTGTAPTAGQLGTFNGAVATAFGSNLKGLMDGNNELTQIETTDLTSPTSATATTAEAIVGTRSGTNITADMCLVTSYRISRRYRGGHPRGYWPFGVIGDLASPGTWGGSFISTADTGFAAFFTAIAAANWSGASGLEQVNVSYYKGFTVVTSPTTGRARNVPTLRTGTITPDVVTSVVAQASVGSQRRRTRFQD